MPWPAGSIFPHSLFGNLSPQYFRKKSQLCSFLQICLLPGDLGGAEMRRWKPSWTPYFPCWAASQPQQPRMERGTRAPASSDGCGTVRKSEGQLPVGSLVPFVWSLAVVRVSKGQSCVDASSASQPGLFLLSMGETDSFFLLFIFFILLSYITT